MKIVQRPSQRAARLYGDIVEALTDDPAKIIAIRRALLTLRTT